MKQRVAAGGFSLLEVVIASSIMLVLTTVVLGFVNAALKTWMLSMEEGEDQMTVLLACHAVQSAMQHSDIHSVVVNPAGVPAGISFLSGLDNNGNIVYFVVDPTQSNPPYAQDGLVLWQRHLVFYLNPTNRTLCEANLPITTSQVQPGQLAPAKTGSTNPTPYQLTSFTPDPVHDRVVAFNIDSLTFEGFTTPVAATLGLASSNAANFVSTPTSNPIMFQVGARKLNSAYPPILMNETIVLDNGFFTGGGVQLDQNILNVQRHGGS